MSHPKPAQVGAPAAAVGHLSVNIDATHPAEQIFLFQQRQKRVAPALGASVITHGALIVLAILIVRYGPASQDFSSNLPEVPNSEIVWLSQPGPGGGGGGGGNKSPEPPRKAELPGEEKITVPVAPLPEPSPKMEDNPEPVQDLTIPAKTLAAGEQTLPGAIEGVSADSLSLGSGSGGGAGTGTGSGIGSGTGSGLGPGYGGGTGGGAYRPGNGVELPRVLREVKPQYTSDAMRAKVQGTVLLECIVQADGSVTDVRVLHSLDPVFGLDQEAIKAAKQWRFAPGTRLGQPVPVIISIELSFTLR